MTPVKTPKYIFHYSSLSERHGNVKEVITEGLTFLMGPALKNNPKNTEAASQLGVRILQSARPSFSERSFKGRTHIHLPVTAVLKAQLPNPVNSVVIFEYL